MQLCSKEPQTLLQFFSIIQVRCRARLKWVPVCPCRFHLSQLVPGCPCFTSSLFFPSFPLPVLGTYSDYSLFLLQKLELASVLLSKYLGLPLNSQVEILIPKVDVMRGWSIRELIRSWGLSLGHSGPLQKKSRGNPHHDRHSEKVTAMNQEKGSHQKTTM